MVKELAVGLVFIMNSVFNPSILRLPLAFVNSGVQLSMVVMGLIAGLSYFLSVKLLDVHNKCHLVLLEKVEKTDLNMQKFDDVESQDKQEEKRNSNCLLVERPETLQCFYEIIGPRGSIVLGFIISSYLLVSITNCYALFASTLSNFFSIWRFSQCDISSQSFFSGCQILYTIYLCLFLFFQSSYLIVGYKSQLKMQVTCFVLTLTTLIITFASCLLTILSQSSYETGLYRNLPKLQSANLSSMSDITVTITLCLMTQFQLGSYYQVFNNTKSIKTCIVISLVTSTGLLALTGFIVSLASDSISADFSKDFYNYSAGYPRGNRPLASYIVSYLISSLPVIISTSSCALYTSTGFSNLQSLFKSLNHASTQSSQVLFSVFTILPCVLAALTPSLVVSNQEVLKAYSSLPLVLTCAVCIPPLHYKLVKSPQGDASTSSKHIFWLKIIYEIKW